MLSIHTLEPYAPLGAYQAGVCADGADYLCNTKNGEYSCRPCNYPQLEMFKELQRQINRLVISTGRGYQLTVDGRIGDDTTKVLGQVFTAIGGTMSPPIQTGFALALTQTSPTGQGTMSAVASVADDIVPYLKRMADRAGAPLSPPTPTPPRLPPMPPLPGTQPGTTVVPSPPGKEPSVTLPPLPGRTAQKSGINPYALGAVAMGTLALVLAYRKNKKKGG